VSSTDGAVHGPPVHHGIEAFVSHSGEAQAPYHTRDAHEHEAVPRHRTKAVHLLGHLLDPVRAVANAFKVGPHANPAGPAFAVLARGGRIAPLSRIGCLSNTLRYCLRKLGVDPSEFSGHSFRRGGATFAHNWASPRSSFSS